MSVPLFVVVCEVVGLTTSRRAVPLSMPLISSSPLFGEILSYEPCTVSNHGDKSRLVCSNVTSGFGP